jgi:hypothetical protein
MNVFRQNMIPQALAVSLLITSFTQLIQSAEVPAGPTPQIPSDPEALAPGTYPNGSVTAVSYTVDASKVKFHNGNDQNDIVFGIEGQGPIPWTLPSYGRTYVSPRIGAVNEEASNSNLGVIPFDIVFNGFRYEWEYDLTFWAPSAAAWRPHPSKGVMLGSIRKNGQEWNDGTPHFHGVLSVPYRQSEGEGYSMVDGSFGEGDMDIVTDKAGLNAFASIDFSAAWFPFDQGWTGGYMASANIDSELGSWIDPEFHSSNLPYDGGELLEWTRQFATWLVPGRFKLPGVNSKSDGMLFTTSVEPDKVGLMMISVAANEDGSGWDLWGRRNTEADGLFQEESNLDFSFLYVPYDADRLIGGHIRGNDGAVINGRGGFALKRLGTGQYELTVPNKTGKDGMVLLQATGRYHFNNRDTIAASRSFLSYEETVEGKFIIESRYYENDTSFPLEDTEFYFAWVDFFAPLAPAGSTPLPDPPVIKQQPADVEVKQGDQAVFSIAATGEEPFEYQWQFNEEDIESAKGQTLEFNDAQPANDGSYRVLVSNKGGVVTSQAATLIVHTPPVITSHPANQKIKVGDALNLNVVVAGTGTIQYQWQYNQNDLADQTSKELMIEDVQLTHAGQYRVIATTLGGRVVSESSVVTVDVSTPVASEPPVITQQPLSQTLAVGSELRLSVEATGDDPISYRWQFNNFNIPGASSKEFIIPNAQIEDSGNYKVVVSNPEGSLASEIAVVTVSQAPVITSQPQSIAAVAGQSIRLEVEARGLPPLAYQWRVNGFNIPGARLSGFSINDVQEADAGNYSVIVTDDAGAKTESDVAILTVSELLVSDISITSIVFQDGGILLTWEGEDGLVLQAKATLQDAQWRDVPGTQGESQSLQATIGNSAFYRLIKR